MKTKGRIYIVDDDELIVTMISRMLNEEGYSVKSECSDFHNIVSSIKNFSTELLILDISLPGSDGVDILKQIKSTEREMSVLMLTSDDSIERAITCMKAGASDYLTKPFNMEELKMVINQLFESMRLRHEVNYLRHICKDMFTDSIVGQSQAILNIREKIQKMALAQVSNFLITGESGTGKELIAREIHKLIHRSFNPEYAPFVAINCSAMPEHLLESELFGYEKGAFTDAKVEKKGLFEIARGGTILLDEIGDMKLALQGKLLRVIEERTLRKIGGNREVPLDVTIIATTNVDLNDAIKKGDFRLDLYYRLNAFAIHMPPLRERKEDIPLLSKYFLDLFTKKYRNKKIKDFSNETILLLKGYHWPGNVRELKNIIERLVVLENDDILQPYHLPSEMTPIRNNNADSPFMFVLPDKGICLETLEKELLIQALNKSKGNKTIAARLLNISYDTLRYQIKKFALDKAGEITS